MSTTSALENELKVQIHATGAPESSLRQAAELKISKPPTIRPTRLWDANWSWGNSQHSQREAWDHSGGLWNYVLGSVRLWLLKSGKAGSSSLWVVDLNGWIWLGSWVLLTHSRVMIPQALITDLCGSSLGVHFAVDCSGAIPVIANMIATLEIRGKAASVGAPAPGKKVEIDVFSLLTMGRQYVRCHQGDSISTKTIPYLMEQHAQGNFPLEKLIKVYE
ncbi:hypothetical protein PENANT_c018G02700 [Penicillium antarcticum]|uniref:Uncharacterized protein n=1 Tax=Penicillium antarcticum TaxID=416450 RepID=A0A1V6Q2M4_9EURO|nr:hypothetical protein PENANT_c018G02700 [Penicillium antarcticum]